MGRHRGFHRWSAPLVVTKATIKQDKNRQKQREREKMQTNENDESRATMDERDASVAIQDSGVFFLFSCPLIGALSWRASGNQWVGLTSGMSSQFF